MATFIESHTARVQKKNHPRNSCSGKERAEREQQRAKNAEHALLQEREKNERLAAKLRALGLNPDEISLLE
jgi:hypothetical protein